MGSEIRRRPIYLRLGPSGRGLPPLRPSVPLLLLLLALACSSEPAPVITGGPPATVAGALVRTSDLHAGGRVESAPARNPYEGDGTALAEGQRLYTWFNCTGCHGGKGGGGIGPPLADDDWIYGGEPQNIFQTIVQGRPNGMPAFGRQVPAEQIWKIVAFVRTLSEPARADQGGSTQRAGASR